MHKNLFHASTRNPAEFQKLRIITREVKVLQIFRELLTKRLWQGPHHLGIWEGNRLSQIDCFLIFEPCRRGFSVTRYILILVEWSVMIWIQPKILYKLTTKDNYLK